MKGFVRLNKQPVTLLRNSNCKCFYSNHVSYILIGGAKPHVRNRIEYHAVYGLIDLFEVFGGEASE